jgi:hypothetical protein
VRGWGVPWWGGGTRRGQARARARAWGQVIRMCMYIHPAARFWLGGYLLRGLFRTHAGGSRPDAWCRMRGWILTVCCCGRWSVRRGEWWVGSGVSGLGFCLGWASGKSDGCPRSESLFFLSSLIGPVVSCLGFSYAVH